MIKILDYNYFEQCANIHEHSKKVSGTIPITRESFENKFIDYFQNNDYAYALGFFENNDLTSWIAIKFHENVSRGKFWTISCFYSKKVQNFFSVNRPEIGLLIKNSMQLAESKKYYQYYYSVSSKISRVYESQWKKNKYVPTGRYDLTVIDTIPAYTKPTKELYWRLMGETVKPDITIIKKRVLKEEFYNNPIV